MRSSSRRIVFVAALLASIVAATNATAEPTATDLETARALYRDGRELRRKGDVAGSLEKFRASYTLAATPITALEYGRSLALTGDLIEARNVLLSIARLPLRPDESEKASTARSEAEELAEALKARLAQLTLTFVPPDAEPRVTIDGVRIPSESVREPRKLNPGSHAIVAESDAGRAAAKIVLSDGEARSLALTLTPGSTAAPSGAVFRAEPGQRSPTQRTILYAGIGLTAASIVVGGVTGILSLSRATSVRSQCEGGKCPPPAHADLDSAQAFATTSNVAFALSAALGAATFVYWLLSEPR